MDKKELVDALRPVIAAKQYGLEDFIGTPPPPARAHTVPHTRSRRRRGSGSIVVLHVLRAPSSMLDSECIVRLAALASAAANLIAEASTAIMPKNPKNFNVDNVRIVKIMGGSILASTVMKG